jgi:branched-chain amino acid transport system permease protein
MTGFVKRAMAQRQQDSSTLIPFFFLLALAALPLLALLWEPLSVLVESLCPILVFGILVSGLHLVTGTTGALHLGVAGFMALGAYTFAILASPVYPFQLSWPIALLGSAVVGALSGLLLGIPTLRLRGDYFAIVSLGFGEIVQDALRNMEPLTKGTIGINPIPGPEFLENGLGAPLGKIGWFYLLLAMLWGVVGLIVLIERSSLGRSWAALRDDELAARCMGISVNRSKVYAMILGSALCGVAGGLWASYLGATGEPGNYDLQISVVVLCGLILGGIGNLWGSILGVFIMVGFNSLVLTRLTTLLTESGIVSSESVITSPMNWKYIIFGLSLVVLMRFRPEGLFPASIRRTNGIVDKKLRGEAVS